MMTWGLIYKTVRGIVTKSVRSPKSQVLHAPKNIQIYKTLRTLWQPPSSAAGILELMNEAGLRCNGFYCKASHKKGNHIN